MLLPDASTLFLAFIISIINTVFLLVIFTLVTYRLARLIAKDEGPFLIPNKSGWGFFLLIRNKLGAYELGDNGEAKSGLGRGIKCPHCVGLWLALPLAFLIDINWLTPFYWLAIAGTQSFLWSLTSESQ